MQPNTTTNPHPTDPPDRPPVPAELLETVARPGRRTHPAPPAARTARRFPRRFADDFAASGLDLADLAAFADAWRARVTASAR